MHTLLWVLLTILALLAALFRCFAYFITESVAITELEHDKGHYSEQDAA